MKLSTINRLYTLSNKMIAAGFDEQEFEITHSKKTGTEIATFLGQLELIARIPDILEAGLGVTISEWSFGYCVDIEPFTGIQFVLHSYRKVDAGESDYNRAIDAAVAALKTKYKPTPAPVAPCVQPVMALVAA